MEKRTILATVLAVALLIIYQAYFAPVDTPKPPPAPPTATEPGSAPSAQAPPPAPAPLPAPSPGTASRPPAPPPGTVGKPPAERPPQRLTTVDAALYRAVVSSEGGKLQDLTLRYRGEKPLVVVGELGFGGLQIGAASQPLEIVPLTPSTEALTLSQGQRQAELILTGEQDGVRVRQALTVKVETYAIEMLVRLENTTPSPRAVTVSLPWTTRQSWKQPERFQGQHPTEIVWGGPGGVQRIEDLTVVPEQKLDGSWIGVGSVWYLAALIPKTPEFKLATHVERPPAEPAPKNGDKPAGRATIAVMATPTIAPGQAWEGRVVMYVGPKEYDRLKALGLEGSINFGGFPIPRQWGGLPMDWLGVPVLLLMNWVYKHVGNYGVAIILLTIVSKILFYPLSLKSMRSMKAMQALAPQVNALRNKYKSDPQRLQRETLELYRQHRVNPMGGCLPMVAQVPIFYALYLALSVSVELQNAAFLCFGRIFGLDLWICDLSAQDPTYVLPILMGVSMFVQQKMTPVMGDPRQAKMMLVMPFVFTFMFLNLPSGLVLYWTVSNVLQILQQWYMERAGREPVRVAKGANRA